MGCSGCGSKYRGARAARTRYVRVGKRRIPQKMEPNSIEKLSMPEAQGTVVEQQQQLEPIAVTPIDPPVDHSTGQFISVIKEGAAGEQQIPDTMPQPEPVTIVPTPGQNES